MERILKLASGGYEFREMIATDLPPRQAQTLLLCAYGFGVKQAANFMCCSVNTIKSLKSALFFRLNVNSTSEMITKAILVKKLTTRAC